MATAVERPETGLPKGVPTPARPPRWHRTVGDAYRRHHDRLIGFFYRRTHDRPLAEDLAHDTMVRFAASAERFDASRPVWPYLRATANNVLTDHLRRDARQVVMDPEEALYDEPGPGSHLDDTVVLRSLLDRAIGDLPERQRIAVELRCERGWSVPDAAAFLGVAPGTFGQLLFRARRNLRAALDEAGARVGGLVLPVLAWVRLRTRVASDRVREIVQAPTAALSGEAIASVLVAASLGVTAVATSTPEAPDESDGSAAVMALVRKAATTPVDDIPPPTLDLPDTPPPPPAPAAPTITAAPDTSTDAPQPDRDVASPDVPVKPKGDVTVRDEEDKVVVDQNTQVEVGDKKIGSDGPLVTLYCESRKATLICDAVDP